jgi:hypothetical protein
MTGESVFAVIIAGGALVVAFIQEEIMQRQSNIMDKQTDLMKEQLTIAKEQADIVLRQLSAVPILRPSFQVLRVDKPNKEIEFEFIVSNEGLRFGRWFFVSGWVEA